jgi:DNA-directed RNA polymerase specialized sigma24 family protein
VSSPGSVTYWIHRLPAGDQAAYQNLWEGYFHRLVGLARKRLAGAPRAAADEEDVALSAFDSFFRRAREGRFPRLVDRSDLWHLLVLITACKASNLAKHERRRPAVHASALPNGDGSSEVPAPFADMRAQDPTPPMAAEVVEEYERLLGLLPDDRLRKVAECKLEGYTNAEIAARVPCALSTVERKLRLIRHAWEGEITP